MICNCYFVLGLFSYLISKSNAGMVSFIKPCKADDKACITSSAQAALPYIVPGIPALGVPSGDPIFIDLIKTEEGEMKLSLSNVTITGVSKCKISEMERNTEKNTIKMVAEIPLHIIGHYDLKGKIRFLEAFGNDEFEIATNNVKIMVEIKIDNIEKDGKKYWKVTGFDHSYDLLDKVHLDFKNLYNGDKEKAKPLEELIDTFSNELVRELGGELIDQLTDNFINIVEKFFDAVSSDELELIS